MKKMLNRLVLQGRRRVLTCAVMISAVVVAAHAGAGTWPQFRGPERDGKAADRGLLDKWPDGGPEQVWVFSELGFGFGSASVTEQAIYVTGMEGSEGFIYALDLDGKLKWKASYGRDWDKGHKGSRTTPTVHDGKLYVMSAYGNAVCFNAETGSQVWSVDTVREFGARNISWGITESPLVMSDKVIFTPGGPDAGVVALHPETGETVWVCKDVNDKSGYCSPFVITRGGKTIIVQLMATTFVGIEADTGKLLWRDSSSGAGLS